MSKLDIPVRLHNDKRGLLSVEDGQLEVLQLSADGSRELANDVSCLTFSSEKTAVMSDASGPACALGTTASFIDG